MARFTTPSRPALRRLFRTRRGPIATDPIAVSAVTVTALEAQGTVREKGAAEGDHDGWVYRCTTALAGAATKLDVTAEDGAGAKAVTARARQAERSPGGGGALVPTALTRAMCKVERLDLKPLVRKRLARPAA